MSNSSPELRTPRRPEAVQKRTTFQATELNLTGGSADTIFAYTNMPVAIKDKSLRLYRAFADPTRLRLLCLLRDAEDKQPGGNAEVCVCDLVSILGVPQPTASRHLAYLRKAGLVQSRKDGLWAYYRLAPATGPVHRKLLDTLEACAAAMPEMEKDSKRLRVVCCDTGCC